MKFFLKKKLKEDAKFVFNEALQVTKHILSGYEFSGIPSNDQLKECWNRVTNDGVRRNNLSPSFLLFEDTPLTVNFIQKKIIYPMLESYVPPEVNGKILLMEHCEALLQYHDIEMRSPYRPEAEISVIWEEIGHEVVGRKAFMNQHVSSHHSNRFTFIREPIDVIDKGLEKYIFGDANFRSQQDIDIQNAIRGFIG
jgi:hypothetical protein